MIRRIAALGFALAVTLAGAAHARTIEGVWTSSVSEKGPGRIYLSIETDGHHQNGSTFDRARIEGLTDTQITSATRVPVHFEMRREAGAFTFDGLFRNGRGAGDFTFVPNDRFPALLRAAGVAFDDDDVKDRELLNLALFDVSVEFVRSMQAIGYKEDLDQYIAFRIFDVNPAYVRAMADVGFDHLSAEKLVETRIHGATPEYIREMRKHGEDLSLAQYVESRIFRVTPEFADEMRRAGYASLDRSTLVQFKIHGVTTEFIDELRKLGYTGVPAQKLVEMRIHNVTPEFIRRVDKAGYHKVPVDKLVQMRIFDIDPEMVKALDESGQ